MLGKTPLAVSPIAALLAEGAAVQNINLPASIIATGSVGEISLNYYINFDVTTVVTGYAYDPTLSIAITSQTIYLPPSTVATASIGSVSLFPTVVTEFVTVATGSATSPSLFYNVNLQTTTVVTASAHDLSALSNIFLEANVTTASVGSISLIPAVDPEFTTVATGSAVSPALLYNINLVTPSVVTASVYNPSILSKIFLEPSVTTASVVSPILLSSVVPGLITVATGSAGGLDLSSYVSFSAAIASGSSYSPGLQYNIVLNSTNLVSASAIDFYNQNVVTTDVPTVVSSTAYPSSLIATVSPGTGSASAYAYSPELIYSIILNTGSAYAYATNPALEYSTVLNTATVATASAHAFSITGSVFLLSTSSLARAFSPGLEYDIVLNTPIVSATIVNPVLELSTVFDVPNIVTASAYSPSLYANIVLTPNVVSASANALGLEYSIAFSAPVSSASVINLGLIYNFNLPNTIVATASIGGLSATRTAGDYYIDPVNGNDANDGLSWDFPWRTMTFGATQPRLIPGDFIKLAKTSDPVSIGCLWTSGSKAVVMGSPRTLAIENCETGWLSSSGSTVSHVSSIKKEGSYSVKVDVSSFSSSSLYAYKQIPTTNYSAYQEVSLWYRTATGSIDAGRWNLCLCSDTSGEVIVDQFPLPAHPAPDRWMPIVVAKTGGGNLASSIQSIALYTTNTPPTSSHGVLLDNIQATVADDLNLTSLVSKNSSSVGGLEGYWAIQSISGSIILLDRDTNCDATSGYGYYGVTEDVTTYIRNTYKTSPASSLLATTIFNVNQSGSYSAPIVYTGGWNTGSNIQDGETYYDGQNGLGIGFHNNGYSFISASRMSFFRYGVGLYVEGESAGHNINMSNLSNNSNTGAMILDRTRLSNFEFGNINSNGSIELTGSCGITFKEGPMDNVVTVRRALSNHDVGVLLDSTNNIRFLGTSSIANNPRGLKAIDCGAGVFIEDTTFKNISVDTSNDSSRITLVNASMSGSSAVRFEHLAKYGYTQKTLSHNHDSTGTNLVSHGGGLITSMTTTRPGGSGLMWQLLTSATHRDSFDPLPLYAGQVYCIANTTTIVKAWMKKDHATQVNGRLAARGRQLAGIPDSITATLANNTDWQELSISLTPAESGLIQIEIWAEYVSGHQSVYYDQGLTIV